MKAKKITDDEFLQLVKDDCFVKEFGFGFVEIRAMSQKRTHVAHSPTKTEEEQNTFFKQILIKYGENKFSEYDRIAKSMIENLGEIDIFETIK